MTDDIAERARKIGEPALHSIGEIARHQRFRDNDKQPFRPQETLFELRADNRELTRFFGYNRPGAKISDGIREKWWLQGMMGGVKAHYDCIKAFSETDFTEDLKKIDVPVLVMHGDDDQIVPIVAAGPLSAKLLKNATLKVYPDFPHGMPTTNADQINADLLTFIKGAASASA